MRSRDHADTPAFEEVAILEGTRRYTSAVDLIRPDREPRQHRRISPWVWVGIGVGLLVLLAIILPAVDREMMRSPMVDGLAAVQRGNVTALRACFTDDGKLVYRGIPIPIMTVIAMAAPAITAQANREGGSASFGGFSDVKSVRPNEVEARFTVWIYVTENEELPYRRMPMMRSGKATLERVQWFRWKIKQITTDAGEVGSALSGTLFKPAPGESDDNDGDD